MAEILQYPRDFFLSGSMKRDQTIAIKSVSLGYALRGLPPVYHRLLVRVLELEMSNLQGPPVNRKYLSSG